MRTRRPFAGNLSGLLSALLCCLLVASPAASALQGVAGQRAGQVKENHPSKGAPGQNLPNLDEARRRGPANPKAQPPVPSKQKKCPPDEPNCNAAVGVGNKRADAGAGDDGSSTPRPHTSLTGSLVAGVANPYEGVRLASNSARIPEPRAAHVEPEPTRAGWLSSLWNLFGSGAPARRTPQGGFENADCFYAWGYAWDTAQPDVPVIVALYDNNQPEPIATVLADLPRQDIIPLTGDGGRHGFRFELPESLRDGASHTLSVKIQGTGFTLASSPKIISSCSVNFQGAITSADCDQVTGWAWDVGRPATPVDVDVFVDGAFAARVAADVYNSQLGKGDNRHQFRVPTPLAARDGQAHSITIRPSGSAQTLGAAASVTCAGPSYYGVVDGADCNYFYGWAWDQQRPNTPVSVDVYADGQLLTTTLADTFRPDLLGAGMGDGRHGYVVAIPDALRDGAAHTLTARIGGGGPPLYGSAAVTCAAQTSCSPAQDVPSAEFVKYFYRGALARAARPAELQYWNDALRAAAPQGQTALWEKAKLLGRELFRQGEYANLNAARPTAGKEEAYVADLYWGYLQRGPESSGQGWWADGVRNPPAGQDGWLNALAAFEGSDEFKARVASVCPAPADFVGDYVAVGDFSPLQNPDGGWAYGYRAAGGSFNVYANRANKWGAGTDTWARDSNGLFVTRNNTGATHAYPTAPSIVQPANVLNLHPGPACEKSVVRWTAPAAGSYLVQGSFKGIDTVGTTTDAAVTHNGASLFSANVNGYGATSPFSLTRTMAAGDALEFAVGCGANGNYNYDSTGLSVTISQPPPAQSQPYPGPAAQQAPGRIEAELFDAGGEGVAYHDATAGAQGQDFDQPSPFPVPAFRQPTDVDINKAAVYSNGYVVRMQAGDWMKYTVDVAQPGSYTLTARTYYWGAAGGTFHVEANGADVTGPLQLPGGSAWVTVSKAGVQLAAGRHALRLVCDSNGSDNTFMGEVDYLQVTADAEAGLVGHWKFDEGAGTSAADSSGGGNGGTLQGGAAWGAARVGTAAVSFDGADDQVQVGARPGLVMTTAATFGAWLYPTGAGSGGALGGIVVNKEGEYEIARFPDGTIHWAFANTSPGWNWVSTGLVAPLNQWTHVAVTYNGGSVKTYANGQLVHTHGGAGSIGDAFPALNDFRVGGRQYMSQHFQGRLDDVRVYNRAMSAAEVGALAASVPADPTGNDFSEAKKDPANETGAGGDDPLSRNFNFRIPLVGLKGRAGLDLSLGLAYNSLVWTRDAATAAVKFDADYGDPSPGFRLGLPVIRRKHVNARGENAYMLVTPSGARVELRQVGASNTYEATNSSYLQLTEGAGLTLRPTDGSQTSFAVKGHEYKPVQIKDRNGNYISLAYDAAGNVSSITDTLGRVVTYAYDANGRPTSVEQNRNGQTHRWATFGYADKVINASFAGGVSVLGPAGGTTLSLLRWVSLADGSAYVFSYNSWGQVYRVERRASDGTPPAADGSPAGRLLSYTEYDLQTPTAAQTGNGTDCPRFTLRKDFIKDWNGDAPAVTTYDKDPAGFQVVKNNRLLNGSGLPVDTPDTVTREVVYGPASDWRKGLVTEVRTFWQGTLRRTSKTTWTQDDEALAYALNPRVKVSEASDPQGNHTGTMIGYTSFGLPAEVREWSVDYATPAQPVEVMQWNGANVYVLRRTHREYNLAPAYVSRRVIGLVGSASVYDEKGHVASKVDYAYDQGGAFLQHQGAPVQHDGAGYGASFVVGRGLVTSARRWDVTALHDVTKSVETRAGYNTTGSAVFGRDPAGHEVKTSYADRFSDKAGANTLAYPTAVTDADGFSSKVEYSFHTGLVARTEDPRKAQQTFTYDAAGRPVRTESSGRDAATGQAVSGGYTRWVYSDAMDAVQSWTKIDAGQPEACSISVLDGGGRARATASDFPGSAGGYRASYTAYDIAGRAAGGTSPTEINGLWSPAGDDAARGWKWTTQSFDWKNRPLVTTLPKLLNPSDPGYGSESPVTREAEYDGCGCAGGEVVTIKGELVPTNEPAPAPAHARRTQRVTHDPLGRAVLSEVLKWNGGVYTATTTKYDGLDRPLRVRQYDGAAPSTEPEGEGPSYQTTLMTYDGHGRLLSRHTPRQDAGRSTVYAYNADDTILRVTDARGVKTNYGYNNRHLVTSITYDATDVIDTPDQNVRETANAAFGYDAAGNRVSMTDGVGAATYAYDALSRLSSETRQFTGILNAPTYTLTYAYNLAGQLKSVTDSSTVNNWPGMQTVYDYDRAGAASGVGVKMPGAATTTPLASGIGYRAWGAVKAMTYGNGAQMSAQYDGRMRRTRYELGNVRPGGSQAYGTLGSETQYYADGRVSYAHDLQDDVFDRAYRYDHAGRLKEAYSGREARGLAPLSVPDNPLRQSYTYDAWDNMSRAGRTWTNGFADAPTYDDSRRDGWLYDADGRNTFNGNGSMGAFDAYDAAGRHVRRFEDIAHPGAPEDPDPEFVTEQNTIEQTYGGDNLVGKRVETRHRSDWTPTDTFVTTVYYLRSAVLGGRVIAEVDGGGWKTKGEVYLGGEELAEVETAGGPGQESITFKHADPARGSFAESFTGGSARRRELDPLGQEVGVENPFPLYGGSYGQMAGSDGLYAETGNPFNVAGGCNLDGMAVSCSLLRDAMEAGAVEGQYLIHGPFGYATERLAILSFGVGVFGTDEPVAGRDEEGPTLDWRAVVFSFQPQDIPRTQDACGDMADIAQGEADAVLATLSRGAHAGVQSAAIRQELDDATLRFDEAFSERYVGRPARTTEDLLDLHERGPVGRTVPGYYFGQTGFKTRYMESRRIHPDPGKGYFTETIVDNDQTHHFATMFSAGINGSNWAAMAHNITDNDGDIRLTNAAYAIGALLRHDPYKGLKNIGKTIRGKICDPATRGPNRANWRPVSGGSN